MKEKLATTVSVTSTYAGEAAGEYISAMLLAGSTLGNNTITIKPNIKYKEVVKKAVHSNSMVANACDFAATGSVTITERILEPKKLMINEVYCKDDFRSDWEAIEMGISAFDNLPPKFSDWLITQESASVAAQLETAIWQGVGGTNSFSGFTVLFKADSDVVDVSGDTITSANVQAEIAKVVTALAALNTHNSGEKNVIYCGQAIITAYLISLGGFGASGVGAAGYKDEGPTGTGSAPLFFAGTELILAPGMPAGEMVGAQPSNLWFGTGLLNDTNTVKVIDTSDTLGDENVRIVMRWTSAVQFGLGAEVVYYWIY